jgi:hypothetical protein
MALPVALLGVCMDWLLAHHTHMQHVLSFGLWIIPQERNAVDDRLQGCKGTHPKRGVERVPAEVNPWYVGGYWVAKALPCNEVHLMQCYEWYRPGECHVRILAQGHNYLT